MPTPDWTPAPPEELLRRVKARGNHLRTRRRASVLAVTIAVLGVTASAAAIRERGPSATSLLAGEGTPSGAEPAEATDEGSTTTTSTGHGEGTGGDGDADDQPAPATTSTSARQSAGASTTAPVTSTTAAGDVVVASAYPHPREGTYRYRVRRSDGSENETRTSYQVLARAASEVRLRELRSGPAADGIGDTDVELSWRDDGVVIVNDDTCDEEPLENPRTLYRFPMAIGTTWSWDSTCSNEDMGEVRGRGSAQVTGRTTQSVAGRTVDVWVIESNYAVAVTLHGITQTHYGELRERFAPEVGMKTWTELRIRQTKDRGAGDAGPVVTELLDTEPG